MFKNTHLQNVGLKNVLYTIILQYNKRLSDWTEDPLSPGEEETEHHDRHQEEHQTQERGDDAAPAPPLLRRLDFPHEPLGLVHVQREVRSLRVRLQTSKKKTLLKLCLIIPFPAVSHNIF